MKITFDNRKDKKKFMDRVCPSHILTNNIELCRDGYSNRYDSDGKDQCPKCYRLCGIEIEVSPNKHTLL